MAETRTRRQFTREFKLEAVRLVAAGDRSLNQVARDLGVRPDMLRQWRRQADGEPEPPRERRGDERGGGPAGRPTLLSQDEEIRRLRRELAQVREERDILGKATAFFAKGQR